VVVVTLNIESTLGRGTRVYVVIPFETEPPSVGKP
jgi:D-arabinose 5-phosphate isomerase GutQ